MILHFVRGNFNCDTEFSDAFRPQKINDYHARNAANLDVCFANDLELVRAVRQAQPKISDLSILLTSSLSTIYTTTDFSLIAVNKQVKASM